ncbi:hypothetical protein ACFWAR_14505 [Streptomyces sp. NPDC059917]|uniref:hypothetical protein n=1 Tax=Streptomyces sp. NPDC059917 TaxID=3347002 RepID=UPI00364AE5B4
MNKRVLGVCAAVLLSVGVATPAGAATAAEPPYDILTMGQGTKLLGIVYEHENFTGSRIEFRGEACTGRADGLPDYQFPLGDKWRWRISSVENKLCHQMGLRDRNGVNLAIGGSQKRLGEWNDQTVTVQFS